MVTNKSAKKVTRRTTAKRGNGSAEPVNELPSVPKARSAKVTLPSEQPSGDEICERVQKWIDVYTRGRSTAERDRIVREVITHLSDVYSV
jgi:hypothetical protein